MAWLRRNGRWAALNLFAIFILGGVLTQGSTKWSATDTFDPGLESGKWAIRFLLFCLGMTPLNTYFGWASAIKIRKPAGLWAFGFAILHVLFYISDTRLTWPMFSLQPYIALGLLGLLVLTALAITSNRWAMQRLGKHWKRLHRLVYLCGLAVVFHAILAASASKKLFIRNPESINELRVYLALLVVLLAVRISPVRRVLKRLLLLRRPELKTDLPIVPIAMPNRMPEYWPPVYLQEMDILPNELTTEAWSEEDVERQQIMVN